MIYGTALGATILLSLAIEPWRAINDGVMGGVSSGAMSEFDEGLRFQGILSLENNGGFSSVRRPVEEDLSNTSGVLIKVRGDGRSYQLRLQQAGSRRGLSWAIPFDTNREWQTLELDFADFEPVYRGRSVPSAGGVEPDRIREIGFLIGDKTPGEFKLDIKEIGFNNSDSQSAGISARAHGN